MRVAIGAFLQETNSFSPVPTRLDAFEAGYLVRGDEVLSRFRGTNTEVAGFQAACAAVPETELAPLLAASACSGGELTADTHSLLRGELVERLSLAHSARPVDVVLLALHGAMCACGEPDPQGDVLEAVRGVVGPEALVAASLDLHANVTQRMASAADILVAYRTQPHVDQCKTGERTAALALAAARQGPRPCTVLQRIPMILPPENMLTTQGPFHDLRVEADRLEAEGAAIAVSVFGVQPWLDVSQAACSVAVVGTDAEAARELARGLARRFWERRREYQVELLEPREAIERALSLDRGPAVLVHSADSPSAGAPGDSTAVLRALLDAGLGRPTVDAQAAGLCLLPLVDEPAAAACHACGEGGTLTLEVGAKLDRRWSEPVTVTACVERLTDGRFVLKGPAFTGLTLDAGPSAVLAIGAIRLLVHSRAVYTIDPEQYRAAGLEPSTARIAVAKSACIFRAAYGPFARDIIFFYTPGAASPNLRSFPWQRIGRPIYPLDEFEWEP